MNMRALPSFCLLSLLALGCSDDGSDSSSETTSESASTTDSSSEGPSTDGDGDGDTGGDGDGDTSGDGDGEPSTSGDGDGEPSTSGDGDGDGGVCSSEGESCAMGEGCCFGLECCIGVPVPPGEEYCSDQCPDSDRRLKREFAAVDTREVLEQLVSLPLSTWSYKADSARTRHIGPMAQDFLATFGVGGSESKIFKVDADGVSFAAIQALHAEVEQLEAENHALRRSLSELERRLDALER